MRVSLEQCTECSTRPRITFARYNDPANNAENAKLTEGLIRLDLRKYLYLDFYKCPDCGTYYRTYSSNYNLRLVRITPVEARLTFRGGASESGPFGEECRYIKNHYKDFMREIQAGLKSFNELVREFAGETKADQYIHLKRHEKVRELLRCSDRAVRKGALWAFAENPREEYKASTPGIRLISGLDKKPFVKGEVFLRSFILQLQDFDSEFRRFAGSFLSHLKWNKKFLPFISQIPKHLHTPELTECLMERIYDLKVLTGYLSDTEPEKRRIALSRVYDLCDNEDTIQKMISEIQRVKGEKTDEMNSFLSNPEAGIPEYDPYD
ncbi:MAG TPA: hypothetical protein PK453_26035 [Leptospiraceae bacterium]|nr:hypothetical protein [Leptospiraceae bacterium]